MQGYEICANKHGILLIADEVDGRLAAPANVLVDHWKVVADLISMAKGLTSAYVQLGAWACGGESLSL